MNRANLSLVALLVVAACGSESSNDGPGDGTGGAPLATGGAFATGGASATGGKTATGGGAGAPASGGAGGVGSGDAAAGGDDGGTAGCREFVMPADCTIPEGAVLPGELRCTGLYGDWDSREIACGVLEFKPAYELWSDGAVKRRWLALPPGETIDASDPDGFVFPVGTRFWKEFRLVAGDGGLILGETRLLQKSDLGWLTTSYVWSADGESTVQTNDGVEDLHGTGHTVPTRDQCKDCHGGRKDFVLGWDFIELGPGSSGITSADAVSMGLLEGAAPGMLDVELPGDAIERAALGYLHANCGVSCHNETLEARGRPSGLLLRLDADQLGSVLETDAVFTGVNRTPNPNAVLDGLPTPPGGYYDFRPLDPDRSLSLVRMAVRGTPSQMPRIGTNAIDEAGVQAVRAWIEQMTEDRGYPAPEP